MKNKKDLSTASNLDLSSNLILTLIDAEGVSATTIKKKHKIQKKNPFPNYKNAFRIPELN